VLDTKWKNIKYSPWTKTLAFVVVWLCAVAAAGSAAFLGLNYETIKSDSYYDTQQFRSQFGSLVRDAVIFYVELGSEEKINPRVTPRKE